MAPAYRVGVHRGPQLPVSHEAERLPARKPLPFYPPVRTHPL